MFFFFFVLHLLPFIGDAQISYIHSYCRWSSLGLNPSVTAASVEDGWKVMWLIGKIRISNLEFLEIAV